MSILNKIFTAIRGGAREAGEAVVDANSIRIFEQEIQDAEEQLNKAKRDLTEVKAKEMQAARKVESLQEDVSKHETYAAQALEKGDEALAQQIAEKIAELQDELEIQKQAQSKFAQHVKRLKGMIKKTNKSLQDMKRQHSMVKTTESVQKATSAITDNYASSSSSLLSAKDSLDRIQQRQQDHEDRMAAGEELQDDFEGGNLEQRLKDAGIAEDSNKTNDILERIKAKQQGGSA